MPNIHRGAVNTTDLWHGWLEHHEASKDAVALLSCISALLVYVSDQETAVGSLRGLFQIASRPRVNLDTMV